MSWNDRNNGWDLATLDYTKLIHEVGILDASWR